jgi:uncharacterized protein (UPF0335 family)
MELPQFDRLEQSVKRAFDRIECLERERAVLTAENCDLKNRLSAPFPAPITSRLPQIQPLLTHEQLAQIKQRIERLIDRIGEMERNL